MEIHDTALLLDAGRGASVRRDGARLFVFRSRLGSRELCLFARTLSGLLEGGVPILRALEGLEKAASDGAFKRTLGTILEDIRRGIGLSGALERSGFIPPFFHRIVHGGEISGRVPEVLSELAGYLEKESALKRSVRDALIYPVFIMGMGFVTLGVLTGFVLPRLESVYASFGTKLPLVTSVMLAAGKAFLPLSFAGLALASGLAVFFRKKGVLSEFLYRAPFLRDFFHGFTRVRFSRLLSLLLESGIPVLEALSAVEGTFGASFIRKDIRSIQGALAKGEGFSDCLSRAEWMDPVSRMLVASGEDTGRLAGAFFQIARDGEADLEARIQILVKLLEPALILVMGLVVGLVVMGAVLPVFDMSGVIR